MQLQRSHDNSLLVVLFAHPLFSRSGYCPHQAKNASKSNTCTVHHVTCVLCLDACTRVCSVASAGGGCCQCGHRARGPCVYIQEQGPRPQVAGPGRTHGVPAQPHQGEDGVRLLIVCRCKVHFSLSLYEVSQPCHIWHHFACLVTSAILSIVSAHNLSHAAT